MKWYSRCEIFHIIRLIFHCTGISIPPYLPSHYAFIFATVTGVISNLCAVVRSAPPAPAHARLVIRWSRRELDPAASRSIQTTILRRPPPVLNHYFRRCSFNGSRFTGRAYKALRIRRMREHPSVSHASHPSRSILKNGRQLLIDMFVCSVAYYLTISSAEISSDRSAKWRYNHHSLELLHLPDVAW